MSVILESKIPDVCVVSAHGRMRLVGAPDDLLIDVLVKNSVPWSATAIYGKGRESGEVVLLSALSKPLRALSPYSEILVYFNRNINPFLFALSDLKQVGADLEERTSGGEYIYQVIDNKNASVTNHVASLSPDSSRDIIAERVSDVLKLHLPAEADLVVGVSGGGDSNAMLYGLTSASQPGQRIHPVIVKGIPDWDAGVPRAKALCADYGLELTVLEESDVREIMGIPQDGLSLVERFEKEFPGDDFEFLGTLIIRIALTAHAKRLGTPYIATGLNLEDVACEQLFRILNGMKPTNMPVRKIADMHLIMPLWMCPKRIIDGCFPKYSLDNYEARYPCFSMGRNFYYSMAYTMQSAHPGSLEKLVKGFSAIAELDPVVYELDPSLGVPLERFVPLNLRMRFEKMLGGA